MGWKSTVDLTRDEALQIIANADLEALDDETLAELVELISGGENHGNNYRIINEA